MSALLQIRPTIRVRVRVRVRVRRVEGDVRVCEIKDPRARADPLPDSACDSDSYPSPNIRVRTLALTSELGY